MMEAESAATQLNAKDLDPESRTTANDDTRNIEQSSNTNDQDPTQPPNDEPSESSPTASPAFTRSKRKRRDGDPRNSNNATNDTEGHQKKRSKGDLPPQPYAEPYVQLANQMIFTMDDKTRQLMESLDLPGNALSGLGYLKSGLRKPTILERWSPWEIGLFQAGLAHHGKQFHLVQKEVVSKSVQEVLDFYLVWKKTSAYKQWKQDYLPPYLDTDDEEDAETTIVTKK